VQVQVQAQAQAQAQGQGQGQPSSQPRADAPTSVPPLRPSFERDQAFAPAASEGYALPRRALGSQMGFSRKPRKVAVRQLPRRQTHPPLLLPPRTRTAKPAARAQPPQARVPLPEETGQVCRTN